MRTRLRSTVLVAAVLVLTGSCSTGDDLAGRAAPTPSASRVQPLNLRAAVTQDVEVLATVEEVLHANALVVTGGQLGSEAVLVTTNLLPPGIEQGSSVRIVGRVTADPPGSDPVMNEYKAAGPIITATELTLD
jgi:hypothetical protein